MSSDRRNAPDADTPAAADLPDGWLDIPDPLAGAPVFAPGDPGEGKRVPPTPPTITVGAPTRDRVTMWRWATLAVCGLWAVGLLVGAGLRPQMAEKFHFIAAQVALWSLVLLGAALLALGSGRRGLGVSARYLRMAALGVPLLFISLALVWGAPDAPPEFGAVGPLERVGICFRYALLICLPITLLSAWSLRHAFPSAAGWHGAALGAASGVASALVLTLHCGSPLGGHIALGHGVPIAISAALGAWVVGKWGRA